MPLWNAARRKVHHWPRFTPLSLTRKSRTKKLSAAFYPRSRGTPDPAAIATPAVELEEPRKLLPAVRPKPVKTANPIKHESEPRGNMTIGNSIVAALKKRALSSLELIELLKLTPQTVYSTCSTLKSKGVD